jgi:HAMP domain-containing protein
LNATTFTPKENLSEQFRESEEIRAATFVTSKTLVYDLILYKIGKLVEEQMGTERKIYYWNYLCTPGKRDFTHLIAILWYVDSLQESYIKSYIDDLNKNKDGFKCFAMSQTNGLIYPIGSKVTSSLANLFSQSFSAKVTKSSQLEYDSKTYVAYGSQGKLLNSAAMVALFPREKIDNQVNFIKLKLIIFALLSFGLTTGIGRVLAIQFLEPVKDLGIGVKAIGKQDFRHRIPIKTADEFGKLGTVFNRAIESLGELEVAKIVQENLFPGENLNQNNLEVFGKSVSMTRLGGDYYDFFPIDKEKTGILMGDVAGHGVPAALIMSMAKASVLMSDTEKRNPAEMMSYLHKVIRSVKSKTIKRMMTCQYFYFDSVSGEFEFANAGHCFPLLIKNKGKTIEQLKLIGTPLGITKRARYTNEKAFMEPGDVMLLYTDGIIESKDSAGNDMGFDNFFELTKNAYSEKLEDFYQNLYNAYLNWSPIADDDITMVLIKLHKEETNG